jgi:hypothetical protein
MTDNAPNHSKAGEELAPVPPAAPNSRFSELEIEQGLMALALESNNSRKAKRRLAALGMKVDHSTLQRWRTKYADKYRTLQADLLPKLREEAAERHSAVADREMEVGLELLDSLQEKTGELPARDLSTAIRNLDVGQGIHRTKAAELRGDAPPPIEVNFSLTDQIRSMAGRGTRFFNASGEPITPEEAIARSEGRQLLPPTSQPPKSSELEPRRGLARGELQ